MTDDRFSRREALTISPNSVAGRATEACTSFSSKYKDLIYAKQPPPLTIASLHGGPGAQQPNQPFTGQYAPSAGFYNDYNYSRALEWLRWMVDIVHTTNEFRNVGMIEVINEPLTWDEAVDSLRSSYYVNAYNVSPCPTRWGRSTDSD